MSGLLCPSQRLPPVYLYRQPVDFRKSYRGLSAIVELELGHDLFAGGLYVFINRARTKLKCLFWDRNGWVLYYKALAEERFIWPTLDEAVLTISAQQLGGLLAGCDITQMREHKSLRYESLL